MTPWATIWPYESCDAEIGADSHFSPLSHELVSTLILLSEAILAISSTHALSVFCAS